MEAEMKCDNCGENIEHECNYEYKKGDIVEITKGDEVVYGLLGSQKGYKKWFIHTKNGMSYYSKSAFENIASFDPSDQLFENTPEFFKAEILIRKKEKSGHVYVYLWNGFYEYNKWGHKKKFLAYKDSGGFNATPISTTERTGIVISPHKFFR